jgi:hypothetical protein
MLRVMGLAGVLRSSRLCPAHCVRQRDEPAGTVGGQTKGDSYSHSGGRRTSAASAAISLLLSVVRGTARLFAAK